MPAHGHGMVTEAKVTELAPGRFRVDGVKLHMPGVWELQLSMKAAGRPLSFIVPVRI
jgi:hypothetical protein